MSVAFSDDLRTGWQVTGKMHPDHAAWADRGGRLFATAAWAGVLTKLGAEPVFAWHAQRALGVVVPVFRRLGLRIGFLGFPVVGGDFDSMKGGELALCAAGIASAAQLDLVRTTQSLRLRTDKRAVAARPEVWIDNLQNWNLATHKRLRKDLAFAHRAAPAITLVERDFDVNTCFDLYSSTVARHAGEQRYEPAYFAALHSLALESPLVGFFAAIEGSVVRGFAIVALNGGLAHYLHGAVDSSGRHRGTSDLLLEKLLVYGRQAGATQFTFMASPWEQPGLLHYKQKWADSAGLSVTFDLGCSLLGRCAALATSWQRRHDRLNAASYMIDREIVFER